MYAALRFSKNNLFGSKSFKCLQNLRAFILVLATGLVFLLSAGGAQAAISQKDVQTIVRAMGFLDRKPHGNSNMAIIYDPASSESKSDADKIFGLLRQEGRGIQARLVPVSSVESIQGDSYAFITAGLNSYHDRIGRALVERGVLSFTTDRACAESNNCAVFISSEGRVEIIVNKSVVEAVQAKFKSAFLLMVTVI